MTHRTASDHALRAATEDLAEQVRRVLETADSALITKAAAVLNDVMLEAEDWDTWVDELAADESEGEASS